jgi:hypothetical protein
VVSSAGRAKKRSRSSSRRLPVAATTSTRAASGAVIGATVHGAPTIHTRQGRLTSNRSRRHRSSQFPLLEPLDPSFPLLEPLDPLDATELESLLQAFDDPTVRGSASIAGHLSFQNNQHHHPQQQRQGSQGRSAEDAICLD